MGTNTGNKSSVAGNSNIESKIDIIDEIEQKHVGRPETKSQRPTEELPDKKVGFKQRVIKFKDVIGLEDVKQKLRERLQDYYEYKDLMLENFLIPSKGMLLCGMPGVGKTMILKAVINELLINNPKIAYLLVDAHELMSGIVGQNSERITNLFRELRKRNMLYNKECVLVIDEIDMIIPTRSTHSVLNRERSQAFLKEMDGVIEDNTIYIIGTTNRPQDIDTAFMRGGRFDDIIEVRPPNEEERLKLLELYFKGVKLVDRHCLLKLSKAEYTSGYTGSDIASLARDLFISSQKKPLTEDDLIDYMKNKFKSLEQRMVYIAEFSAKYRALELGSQSAVSILNRQSQNKNDPPPSQTTLEDYDAPSQEKYAKRTGVKI